MDVPYGLLAVTIFRMPMCKQALMILWRIFIAFGLSFRRPIRHANPNRLERQIYSSQLK